MCMTKSPSLLQINLSANVGSTGRIAEDIGKLIKEKGWRSVIAYGRFASSSKSELIRIGRDIDLYEHLIETRLFDNHGLASRCATKKFIERAKELKPDIIHLHNIHGYYLNYRILFEYLNQLDIPVVWTFHDCWPFTGHCGQYLMVDCHKWESGCGHCPQHKEEYPFSYADRSRKNYELKKSLFSANKYLHIVPVSEWMAGNVRRSFFRNADVRVINNGINTNSFKPQTERKKNTKIQILGVSNVWTAYKGLNDFYKLRSLLNEDDYDITLVGLTKSQIARLPNGIFGVERTQSISQLAELYANSDFFVNPTYCDTFPTVNIEALACGTPVLTYKVGGSPETIDRFTGWVFEKGDVLAIAKTLNDISHESIEDTEERRNRCRIRAVEKYDKDDRYNDYMTLYKELLGK